MDFIQKMWIAYSTYHASTTNVLSNLSHHYNTAEIAHLPNMHGAIHTHGRCSFAVQFIVVFISHTMTYSLYLLLLCLYCQLCSTDRQLTYV